LKTTPTENKFDLNRIDFYREAIKIINELENLRRTRER